MGKKTLVEELQDMGSKNDPMTPRTLRLPPNLDNEIQGFCGKANVRFSVAIREIVRRGWNQLKAESEEVRKLAESVPELH